MVSTTVARLASRRAVWEPAMWVGPPVLRAPSRCAGWRVLRAHGRDTELYGDNHYTSSTWGGRGDAIRSRNGLPPASQNVGNARAAGTTTSPTEWLRQPN